MENQFNIETQAEDKLPNNTLEGAVQSKPSGNKVVRGISSFLSGRFLISDSTLKYMPFVLFLALVALCYIANGYYAQSNDRQLNKLNSQLAELRTRYVITKSTLMYVSKESQIAQATASMGLKEAIVPPQKITVMTNNPLKP